MSSLPGVTIVTVTYNRLQVTRECVEHLRANTLHPFVLIAVDNDSQDGTVPYLLEAASKGLVDRVVLLDRNYGVAPASNTGWELCETPYYMKLDNDMLVQKPGWLQDMVTIAHAERESDFGVISYSFWQKFFRRKFGDFPEKTLPSGHRVLTCYRDACLDGGCVLISDIVHREFGFWCEDFGQYGAEDADYGMRMNMGGRKNYYMPQMDRIVHSHQRESSEYKSFKDSKHHQNIAPLGNASVNIELYNRRLRPFKMRRRYQTIFESDGIHARLVPDPDYMRNEGKLISDFRKVLKNIQQKPVP